MNNLFNNDFKDFLKALNNNKVEYILAGGYAVIIHGYNRTTGDLDIWVNRTKENYRQLVNAFQEFKMPLMGMTEEKFLNDPESDVFTYGRPPVSIDIMTQLKGLSFEEAYPKAVDMEIDLLIVKVIDYRSLILAKKASGRHKDKDDISHLEK